MQNRVKLARRPEVLVLDFLDRFLVRCLEHVVAGDVVALLLDVLPDLLEGCGIRHAGRLQQRDEVVGCEDAVGASVTEKIRVSMVWYAKGMRLLITHL